MRLATLFFLALSTVIAPTAWAQTAAKEATVYKDAQCGCCEGYVAYLRDHGFNVKVVDTHDLPLINQQHGVPERLQGCHVMMIDGYVVEGHVPVGTLDRLLTEKPSIKGISLPGMPQGSPGMYGIKSGPFTIYEIGSGTSKVYATE